MDAKAILDRLMDSSQQAARTGVQMAEERQLIPPAGDERTAMLKGMGTGALAAGAVALLFGSKGTKKFVKKAAKVGGTAAIGGLAYHAFREWQQSQTAPGAVPAAGGSPGAGGTSTGGGISTSGGAPATLNLDQFSPGTPISDLETLQANVRSEAIVSAMIAAARADGHVSGDELSLISQQISNFGLEKDVSHFLMAELNKPVDHEAIAALADSPEAAAEIYIASAMVADIDGTNERQYLDKLAVAMKLSPDLVQRLEAPLRA